MIVPKLGQSLTYNKQFDGGKPKREQDRLDSDCPGFTSAARTAEGNVSVGVGEKFRLLWIGCAERDMLQIGITSHAVLIRAVFECNADLVGFCPLRTFFCFELKLLLLGKHRQEIDVLFDADSFLEC